MAPVVRLALKSLYRLESHEIRELSEIVQNLRPGRMFLEGPPFLTTCHLVQPEYFLVVRGGEYRLGRGIFFTLHTMTKKSKRAQNTFFAFLGSFSPCVSSQTRNAK